MKALYIQHRGRPSKHGYIGKEITFLKKIDEGAVTQHQG